MEGSILPPICPSDTALRSGQEIIKNARMTAHLIQNQAHTSRLRLRRPGADLIPAISAGDFAPEKPAVSLQGEDGSLILVELQVATSSAAVVAEKQGKHHDPPIQSRHQRKIGLASGSRCGGSRRGRGRCCCRLTYCQGANGHPSQSIIDR